MDKEAITRLQEEISQLKVTVASIHALWDHIGVVVYMHDHMWCMLNHGKLLALPTHSIYKAMEHANCYVSYNAPRCISAYTITVHVTRNFTKCAKSSKDIHRIVKGCL